MNVRQRISPISRWVIALLAIAGLQAWAQPYQEQEVSIANGPITLAGTLTLPERNGPFPAVILLSGSGPQDRDEFIPQFPGYKPFAWIADYLARSGFAVLRYDDRGAGKSTGQHDTATSADFSADAEAAFNYLLSRREVDANKVGFLGHSEGGLLAAMVAARNPKVAFVVSMAGPGVRGYELLLVQLERALKASNTPEDQIKQMLEAQKKSLDFLLTKDWKGLEEYMYPSVLAQLQAMPEEKKKDLGDLEQAARAETQKGVEGVKGWMAFFVAYDPAQDWAKVRVPVLALFGDLDVQVDVSQNRAGLEAALAKAGNPNLTVRVFPTANHLFQEAKTGSPGEYAALPMKFVPGFLGTILGWLEYHFK